MSNLTINWNWGSQQTIAFDPAHDTIDFGWFQGGQFTIDQVGNSTVIRIPTNNQSYTLTGVSLHDLQSAHVIANDASAAAAWKLATSGPGGDPGPVNPPTPVHTGTTVSIDWHWGTNTDVQFDAATDKIDLGWFQAGQFTLSSMDGMVMIEIPNNDQMYMLDGVTLGQLTADNFVAKDAGALAYIQKVLADGDGGMGGGGMDGGNGGNGGTDGGNGGNNGGTNGGDNGGNNGGNNGGTSHPNTVGTDYVVSLTGPDITGFDPMTDRLDLGNNSVHSFIIEQTPDGVAFRTPWNTSDYAVIKGVSLEELNVNDFVAIDNKHLREDVSGAMAWAHGIQQAAHTVYALSDQPGRVDRVAFDPTTDKVDFRFYATRELIHMKQTDEGVLITNDATHEDLILEGVKIGDLSGKNFIFHESQIDEDHLDQQLGIQFVWSNVLPTPDIPTAGVANANAPMVMADGWPPVFYLMGGDDKVTGGAGNHMFDFSSATIGHDTISDFKVIGDALQFSHTAFATANDVLAHAHQVGSDTVITIDAGDSVTLSNVTLSDLHASAIHII